RRDRRSRSAPASLLVFFVFFVRPVLGRCRIELPAMTVTLADLLVGVQLFVVLILDPQRAADVGDTILVGRGIIAARRFVADGIRVGPLRVEVAGREPRA